MPISKGIHNWLLVLGLEFDPAPSDEKTIATAFEAKRKFVNLSNSRNDPQKGEYYKTIADLLDKTEAGMPAVLRKLNDTTQREQLAEDAQRTVYKLLDKYITEAAKSEGRGDDVESHKFPNIARVTQKFVQRETHILDWECTAEMVRKRVEALGFTIVETGQGGSSSSSKTDEEAAYEPYSKKSKWRSKNWGSLDDALGHFGCSTLYEYACPAGYDGDPASAPSIELLKRAEELRDAKKQHNAEKSSAELIASNAKSIFQNDASRAEYNKYIEFNAVNDVLERFESLVDVGGGQVGDEALNGAIREVASVVVDKSKAPLIVRGFCRKNNKKFSQHMEVTYCRCGYANSVSSSACQGCGLPLSVQCPACGKKLSNTSEYCSCGAPVGKTLGEVDALCASAINALNRFDFSSAESFVKQSRAKWPGLSRYEEIDQRIASAKRTVGPVAEKLNQLMSKKQYVSAQEAIQEAKRKHPGFSAPAIEREIAERIAEAEGLAKRATSASSESERLDLYERALAACADHRGALSFMRSNPPAPPTKLKASVDPSNGTVRLVWNASASSGSVVYTVRRCEGSTPLNADDGIEVSRGSATRAEDVDTRSGRPYYYAVVSLRCGVPSPAVKLPDPVYATREIADLAVTPGDGVVEFRWSAFDSGEAEIVEIAPEQRIVARSSNGFYSHTGLANGTTYSYRVRAVYRIEGKEVATTGLPIDATPIGTSDLIGDFRAVKEHGSDRLFKLSWTEVPASTVKLFSSTERSAVPEEGTVLSLGEVESAFAPAGVQNQKRGCAGLLYGGDVPLFVFPVLVYGRTAVVGNCARVFGKEEIRITDVRRMNDELVIRIDPPAKAVAFVVLCRSDRFVRDVGESDRDGDQMRRQIPMKTYERDGAIRIKYAGPRDYYISVCAVYGSPSSPVYSELTECLFSTKPKASIGYSIKALKIPFLAPKVTLTFYSDAASFNLPQTIVEYGLGGLPVFSGSGTRIATIPAQEVNGTLEIEVSDLPNRKGVYLKASPVDNSHGAFVLDPHSNCKIS